MIAAPESRHSSPPEAAIPRRKWSRETLRLLLGAAVVLAAAVLLRRHFGALESWLGGLGSWAPIVFVLIHVVATLCFFPVSVLGFLAGMSFGFWYGTAVLFVGGLLSASIMFVLARRVISARVRAFAGSRPRLARFLDLAEDDAPRLMVLMRLSPLNFALVSYILGASRVRYRPYLLTSALVLPSAALQAYVGHTARLVGRQTLGGGQPDLWRIGAAAATVVAAVILTVMFGRLARRALADGTAAEGDQGAA